VPPDADDQLRDVAATVVCPREPGVVGDPAYLRLLQELDSGTLPFTTQGNENGLTIEGGQTLGFRFEAATGHPVGVRR
jgi:hypothetical protein